jgi:hypothetical protein
MTAYSVQNDSVYSVIVLALCHAEQREASPRWLHTIHRHSEGA